MIIKNKRLDIDTNDVYECTDKSTLYAWLITVYETLKEINEKLTEAKAIRAGKGIYADRDWFTRTDTARRLQEILALQIKQKIIEIEDEDKKLISILRTHFSQEQWNQIIKQLDKSEN